MDLNQLFYRQQVLLMRASAVRDHLLRSRHLAAAGTIAEAIRHYRLSVGWNADQRSSSEAFSGDARSALA